MTKKENIKYKLGSLFCLVLLLSACTDTIPDGGKYPEGGAVLNLITGVGAETRLAELGNTNNINDDKGLAHKHIGLYIYYKEDYDKDILSQPYIRNMECKVEGGKLVPVNGTTDEEKKIYIYDNMTIVAFYPYNPEMSKAENFFTKIEDEENYPITEEDYSDQYYIPYRGILPGVNPTNAYSAKIWLYPKHTVKIEVILISDSLDELPDGTGDVRILPDIDPVTADLSFDCKRAAWVDRSNRYQHSGGGSNMGRYTAYLWQRDGVATKDHIIPENTLLFKSDNLTLFTSEEINFAEGRAYRFGYNLTTGEVFIPTSDQIVYDAQTLQNANCVEYSAYQACDISLEGVDWKPIIVMNGRFDGGGHRITDLKLTGSYSMAGLFSTIKGDSEVRNVNLIKPAIHISNITDSCYVGSICGRMNSPLTSGEVEELSKELPDELSDVVKKAILQEMMGNLVNSTSQLISCRVEEPQIMLVNVKNPRVGAVAGSVGEVDEYGTYHGRIWDCYSLGGKIEVNVADKHLNMAAGAQAAAFCGYNYGTIRRSYTTTSEINFKYELTIGAIGMEETIVVEKERGFSFNNENSSLTDCYCIFTNGDDTGELKLFSEAWPAATSWIKYTLNKWPVYTQNWTYSNNSFWWDLGANDTYYPKLQWERK